jgi:hypothetical protein
MLKKSFTRSTISEFLNKYRGEFNEWKATRIRPGQLKYIQSLLEKTGSQVDELTLYQFSQEEAGAYIEQLLNESKTQLPSSIIEITHDLPISITSVAQAEETEQNNLEKLIYGLIAETGLEPADDVDQMLGSSEMLLDYFSYLFSEGYLSRERLELIVEESSILQDIFKNFAS